MTYTEHPQGLEYNTFQTHEALLKWSPDKHTTTEFSLLRTLQERISENKGNIQSTW